jgi:hypothetical protein
VRLARRSGLAGLESGLEGASRSKQNRVKEREKGEGVKEGRREDFGLKVHPREKRRWEVAGGRLKGGAYLGQEEILVAAEVVRKGKKGPLRVEEGEVYPQRRKARVYWIEAVGVRS